MRAPTSRPDVRDMHVSDFARILAHLEPHPPITEAYDDVAGQRQGVWYTSQRQHMVSWFRGQLTRGSGRYTRAEPNPSARTTYNRLFSPGAIIWIAEALGEEPTVVRNAADAAQAEPNLKKRPGILRKHLPWNRIITLAQRAGRRELGTHDR